MAYQAYYSISKEKSFCLLNANILDSKIGFEIKELLSELNYFSTSQKLDKVEGGQIIILEDESYTHNPDYLKLTEKLAKKNSNFRTAVFKLNPNTNQESKVDNRFNITEFDIEESFYCSTTLNRKKMSINESAVKIRENKVPKFFENQVFDKPKRLILRFQKYFTMGEDKITSTLEGVLDPADPFLKCAYLEFMDDLKPSLRQQIQIRLQGYQTVNNQSDRLSLSYDEAVDKNSELKLNVKNIIIGA